MRCLERQVIDYPQSYPWAAYLFLLPTVDGRQTKVNCTKYQVRRMDAKPSQTTTLLSTVDCQPLTEFFWSNGPQSTDHSQLCSEHEKRIEIWMLHLKPDESTVNSGPLAVDKINCHQTTVDRPQSIHVRYKNTYLNLDS